jgi:hypothetical protein
VKSAAYVKRIWGVKFASLAALVAIRSHVRMATVKLRLPQMIASRTILMTLTMSRMILTVKISQSARSFAIEHLLA